MKKGQAFDRLPRGKDDSKCRTYAEAIPYLPCLLCYDRGTTGSAMVGLVLASKSTLMMGLARVLMLAL